MPNPTSYCSHPTLSHILRDPEKDGIFSSVRGNNPDRDTSAVFCVTEGNQHVDELLFKNKSHPAEHPSESV